MPKKQIAGIKVGKQKADGVSKFRKFLRTIGGAATGGLIGLLTGGPLGAAIGAGGGGLAAYGTTLDPETRSHILELASIVDEIQKKPIKTAQDKQDLAQIGKNYPDLLKNGASERVIEAAKSWPVEPNGNKWTGNEAEELRFQQLTPEQQKAQSEILQSGLKGLREPFEDSPYFKGVEERARSDFNNKTLPGIAERFAGANALRSSAFTNSLRQGATDFDAQLAGLRGQYGLAQEANLQDRVRQGLTPQYKSQFRESGTGLTGNLLKTGLSVLPKLLGK